MERNGSFCLLGQASPCWLTMKITERIDEYLSNIDSLPHGLRVQLRRAVGQRLGEASTSAMGAFYRCLPHGRALQPYETDAWFAAGCMHCLWNARQTENPETQSAGKSIPQILRQMSQREDDALDKYSRRLASLLDISWGDDGYLLGKVARLVKQMQRAGDQVNCSRLLLDLLRWNDTDQIVQKRWSSEFYGVNEENNESEENKDAD